MFCSNGQTEWGLKQYLEHFDIIYMKLIIILLIQKGGKLKKKNAITSKEIFLSKHKGGLKLALGVFSSRCSMVAWVPCSCCN